MAVESNHSPTIALAVDLDLNVVPRPRNPPELAVPVDNEQLPRSVAALLTTKRGRESFLMILSAAREAAPCTPPRIASPSGVSRLPRQRGGPATHSASVEIRLLTI